MPRRTNRKAKAAERLPSPSAIRGWFVPVGLVAAVVVIYAQTGWFDFVPFDDGLYFAENPIVRAGITRAGIAWAFGATHLGFWIPGTWVSFMVGAHVFGPGPGPEHLLNVALHAANAVLVFVVLRRATNEFWPSAFVAAIFAVHPLHVESVAWITERKDVLSTLFWLLAVLVHFRVVARPTIGSRAAVVALAAMAVAAKPMAVTLPLTLLVLDLWPLARHETQSFGSLVLEKVPLFVVSVGTAIVTTVAHAHVGAAASLERVTIDMRAANAVVSIVRYLAKAVWPVRLAVFYPYPANYSFWAVSGSAVVIVAISGLVVALRTRRPYLLAGWSWFLMTLLPVIGIVQAGEQSMADRFVYVPLVGLGIMVAWTGRDLLAARPTWRGAIIAATAIAIVALGARAWDQTRTWRDGVTLFSHALAVTPDNVIARHDLARALADRGNQAAAIANYEAALRLAPDRVGTLVAYGAALQRTGHLGDARSVYEHALEVDPSNAGALNNLGLVLAATGDIAGARARYDEALRLDSNNVDALVNLASLLAQEGRRGEAIALLERAVTLDAFHAAAKANLRMLRGR